MTRARGILQHVHRVLGSAGVAFLFCAGMALTPHAASALGPDACYPGGPPPAPNQPCEGWPVTTAPSPTGTLCKLELFDASGTVIAPASTDTCYPPGVPPPPGSFPCMVIVSPTAYGQGSCTSQTTGALPPGYTVPAPPPPPAPPTVSAASCTQAPPGTWYDPQDPTHGVPSAAPAWMTPAQNFASALFKTLFVFEIFMLGVQAVLHRHDIAQLFSGFAFKTFLVTFFIYVISMSPTLLPQVFGSFQIAGQSVAASTEGNLMTMNRQAEKAAGLFFCAAMASHIDDRESALEYGYFGNMPGHPGIPYNGDVSHTLQSAIGHITFEFFVQGLGMLVIAGAGVMFLSLALITAESYITMFAGVFFIGFSSTRFTLPFTQGYLSYAVNVGVKMFTYWVLIAVESSVLMPVLVRAGTGLINAASIQFGPGSEMYLLPAGMDVAQTLAMAALTWFLPSLAGRFVSGRNSPSVTHVIANVARSFKKASLIAAPASAEAPSPMDPMRLSQGVSFMTPFKEMITSIAQPAANTWLSNAFLPQAQAFVSPSSPTSAAAASAAASTDNGPTISGNYKQPVQASVSDGADPFAFKPKPKPIVLSLQPRMKPSTAPTPPQPHAQDQTPRQQNTPAQTVTPTNPTPGFVLPERNGQEPDEKPHAPAAKPMPRSTNFQTLDLLSPQQMKLLPPEQFTLLLEATPWNTLSAEHLEAIEQDERLRSLAAPFISQRPHAPETS